MSVLAFIFLLTGCGAGSKVEINKHSPSNSSVIYVESGESQKFSAYGPVYSPYNEALLQIGVRAQWNVYTYAPNGGLVRTSSGIKSVPATWANANNFEFTTPENEPAQYYLVTYTVYRHSLGGTWEFTDNSRSWLLYAGENQQTPPQWQGDFVVSSNEDLTKLAGYTDINGSLNIIPFTSKDADGDSWGRSNLIITNSIFDGRDHKHVLPLGDRSEENLITNLSELSDISHVGGSLYITHNEKLESFEGLQSLQNIEETLAVRKNDLISNMQGFENLSSLGSTLSLTSNPILNSIDGLNGLEFVGGFNIESNPNLCDSQAQALLDLIESRGGVDSEVVTIENDDSC